MVDEENSLAGEYAGIVKARTRLVDHSAPSDSLAYELPFGESCVFTSAVREDRYFWAYLATRKYTRNHSVHKGLTLCQGGYKPEYGCAPPQERRHRLLACGSATCKQSVFSFLGWGTSILWLITRRHRAKACQS